LPWLLTLALGIGFATLVTDSGSTSAARKKEKPKVASRPADSGELVEQVDLGVRDVLERLKLLRVQMALDREEIAALRLRMEKIELQREFEALLGGPEASKSSGGRPRRVTTGSILVKAISLKPRKEAIIMYRGRIYNVRPGDKIGGMTIQDISESGLKVARTRGEGESFVR
jgi:hypothetical protein